MDLPNFFEQFVIALLSTAISSSCVYVLGSLGEIIAERAGVFNLGIEGYMLMGSIIGYLVTYFTGNPWIGILGAIIGSMLLSLVHAYFSITLGGSQFVSGIGINTFAFGFSLFLYEWIFAYRITPPPVPSLKAIEISVLSQIPVLGPILFRQSAFVYIAICLALICTILLYRTTLGLNIRAVGDYPLAAETVGVNVHLIRYLSVILCGLFAGLGGSFLTLSYLSVFAQNATAGRGFICLAIVIVAGWDPIKALGMSLLYGVIDAVQIRLQILRVGIPYPFLLMLPYIATIIVLLVLRKRVRVPSALAIPYVRKR